MKPVLLDTGVIVSLLHRQAARHEDCVAAVTSLDRPLVTCEAVISESCYLLRKVPGAADAVLANVEQGIFQIPLSFTGSISAIRAIMQKYRNLPADFADVCLVHLADMLNTGDILTLDRHFAAYRWRRNNAFRLLISLSR